MDERLIVVTRHRVKFLLFLILLAFPLVRVSGQETVPAKKDAWVAKLSRMTLKDNVAYNQDLREFSVQDPDLVYAVSKEAWPRIKEPGLRSELVASLLRGNVFVNGVEKPAYEPNPHLLDIMALALKDTPEAGKPAAVRNIAGEYVLEQLRGMAFQEMTGPDDLRRWRASSGNKPVAALVQESSRGVVNTLENGSADQKLKALELLGTLHYYTGTTVGMFNGVTKREHEAAGIMDVRRKALLDAKLPAALGALLRPENPEAIRRGSVRVLARLQPGDDILKTFESDIRRELTPFLAKPVEDSPLSSPFLQPYYRNELICAFNGDWAVNAIADLVHGVVARGTDLQWEDYTLFNTVMNSTNPRFIPVLIELLPFKAAVEFNSSMFEGALRRWAEMNDFSQDGEHDTLWWRLWLFNNQRRFPPGLQKLSTLLPRKSDLDAPYTTAALPPRRRAERVFISEDPKRSYWLLSPEAVSTLLTERGDARPAKPGLKKLEAAPSRHPGLVILLTDSKNPRLSSLESWQELSDALAGRYFLAVAIPPRGSETTAPRRWPTQKDFATVPAAFSTETFAAQIASQVQSNAAIDPEHFFLVSEGDSGIAGYACALQKATPFKGFCLLSASFRSALLPPLSAAKGRRFFLALGLEGGGSTDSLAAAAESVLKQQGAAIQSERVKSGSALEAIQHGVLWLER